MDEQNQRLQAYEQAITCLAPRLMGIAKALPEKSQETAEELRLRAGQPIRWVANGQEHEVSSDAVRTEELRDTLARASRWSVHTFYEPISQGYLPLVGGHRLGVCGTVSFAEGKIQGIRTVSSLSLRIAREHKGIAEPALHEIWNAAQGTQGTLILSPPAGGKTTFLRDCIRLLSMQGVRVGVVDTRGEIAAMRGGMPQFDLGGHSDILDGCPKALGALQLVRTMAPQVLALDEVTDPEDLEAIRYAANCGVTILATIHAAGTEELKHKPLFHALYDCGAFTKLVILKMENQTRYCTVQTLEGGKNGC